MAPCMDKECLVWKQEGIICRCSQFLMLGDMSIYFRHKHDGIQLHSNLAADLPLNSSPKPSTHHPNPSSRPTPLPLNLDPHLPVSISPPNTPFLTTELLQLPHLNPSLTLLQRLLARPPRRLSMWRRHRDQDTLLSNRNRAKPMDHGYGGQIVLRPDVAGDGEECGEGEGGVGCVLELEYGFVIKVVARRP